MSKIAFLSLVFITYLGGQTSCGYHAPPEYKKIFDLPRDQQEVEFKKLPMDKQVDMYLYAMYREPPDTKYVDYLASNGKEVIPSLLQRLEGEKRDSAKAMLIDVFQTMNEEYYSLKNEVELIRKLRVESAKIKDAFWRGESEKSIEDILEGEGVIK